MFTAGQSIDSSIMHRKQGTFSYRKNSPQTKDIGNNLRIKTEKMTNDVARVYFIDNQENPTPPPANVVCTCSSTGEIIQSAVINGAVSFIILWMYSYEIKVDDIKIFSIENQKQQALTVIEQ